MGIMMIAGTERRHQDCSLQDGKQWGYIESLSGTRDLNLPLAYVNRHLCVVATGGNTKGYGAIRAQTISLTQVRLYAYTSEDGAYSHYLSLGYQPQWGMAINHSATFTYPIAFASNNILAFKQAKSNGNGNNYLMREAGIGIPNNVSVTLPGTSPALSFYVVVIGW